MMEFGWNDAKRERTLAETGVDFAAILAAFAYPSRKIAEDNRKDYGEARYNIARRV